MPWAGLHIRTHSGQNWLPAHRHHVSFMDAYNGKGFTSPTHTAQLTSEPQTGISQWLKNQRSDS